MRLADRRVGSLAALAALLLTLWHPAIAEGVSPKTRATPSPAASDPTAAAASGRDSGPPADAASDDTEPLLTFEGGIDFTNAYYERGYRVEDAGLIVQPSLTAFVHPSWLDFGETSISPYLSTWNSLHTVASPHSPSWWYEADVAAGFEIEHGHTTLDVSCEWEGFPGGAEQNESEIGATLEYDDHWLTQKRLHLPFVFAPHIGIYQALAAPSGAENGRTGTYLELGLEPSHTRRIFGTSVTLSVPIVVGMSLSNVYSNSAGANQTAGFVSSGLRGKFPLALPREWGKWQFVVGADYMRLLAKSAAIDNRGDRDVVIGKMGLVFSY